MELDREQARQTFSKDLTEILIRVALIAFLVIVSAKIFAPFMGLMLWGLILAVTLYPLQQKFARKMGGKQGRAATALVLLGILLIGGPTVLLGTTFIDYVSDVHTAFQENTVTIKAPKESVAEWPVIGEKVYAVWSLAAEDLPALLEKMQPRLGEFSKSVLAFVGSAASGIFQFLFSLIIAGIMMAYGEAGSKAMSDIMCRLVGAKKGPDFHVLSTATIRSVAMGVIGVAFIQALLLGMGFVWADVPAAGLLAIIVLVLGIAQVPAALVSLPVIAYVWWSGDSTVMNVVWTIYLLVAGMIDGVLKPLMLGRGVEAPMPIILLGALGGMVSAGLIGLFVGAVFLTLGYVIFMEWVAESADTEDETVESEAQDAEQSA